MEPTKHQGSCHCGDVRYEVVIDASKGTRCNCTICTKLGMTGGMVKPAAFTLLTDPAKLDTYSRMPEIANRYFCKKCHVLVYGAGNIPEIGGEFVSIALNTLDDHDLGTTEVSYWDGRHDNWHAGTRPAPWPTAAAPA